MKQESPVMIREMILNELILLHKSIEKNDYKNAKLHSIRIHSLCDALIPKQDKEKKE